MRLKNGPQEFHLVITSHMDDGLSSYARIYPTKSDAEKSLTYSDDTDDFYYHVIENAEYESMKIKFMATASGRIHDSKRHTLTLQTVTEELDKLKNFIAKMRNRNVKSES